MDYKELLVLVERAKAGDAAAFEAICREKATDILYICIQYMGNRPDGEDAAQEVFLHLQKSIHRLQDPQAFTAWLNRLITNTCLRLLRKRNNRKDSLSIDAEGEGMEELQLEFLPQEFAERAEKRQVVLDALGGLSFKSRQVLVLFYYEGLSTKEVARALEITPKAAERMLYRARGALKKQIGKRLGKEPEAGYTALHGTGGALVLARILHMDANTPANQQAARQIVDALGAPATASAATGLGAALGALASSAATWAALGTAATMVAVAVVVSNSSISSPPGGASTALTRQQNVPQQVAAASAGEGMDGALIDSSPETTVLAGEEVVPQPSSSSSQTGLPGSGGAQFPVAPATSAPLEQIGGGNENTTAPTAPLPDKPQDTGSDAPAGPEPPASEEEKPLPGTIESTLPGGLYFTDAQGNRLDEYNGLAHGFIITLLAGETPLAQTTADEEGRFTLQGFASGPGLRVEIEALFGFQPPSDSGFTLELDGLPAGEGLEIAFTDKTPPGGAIHFYAQGWQPLPAGQSPYTATITAYASTKVALSWQVREENGETLRQGTGPVAYLASLHSRPGSYSLICTITDAAGNTAQATRDFVVSG